MKQCNHCGAILPDNISSCPACASSVFTLLNGYMGYPSFFPAQGAVSPTSPVQNATEATSRTDMDKTELLDRLYALRAGISAVAQEQQKATAERDDCNQKHATLEDRKNACNIAIGSASSQISTFKRDLSYLREDRVSSLLWIILGLILLGIGATYFILLIIGIIEPKTILALTPMIIAGLIVMSGLGFLFHSLKDMQFFKGAIIRHKIKSVQKVIVSNNEQIKKLQTAQTALKNSFSARVAVYLTAGNQLYNAVAEQFSALLDTRDWAYLDYIIFCFETNRCDTMRDALLQTDRQRQTDEIVAAVDNTCKVICEAIRHNADRIVSTLEKKFSALFTRMDKANGYLQSIANSSAMMVALQEQANRTSIQIMNDVSALRSSYNEEVIHTHTYS